MQSEIRRAIKMFENIITTNVNIVSIAVLLTFMLIIVFKNLKIMPTAKISLIYIIIFLIRLLLLFYRTNNGYLPMSGSDWGVFHRLALNLVYSIDNIWGIIFPDRSFGFRGGFYEQFVAIIYYVFGVSKNYMHMMSFIFSEILFRYIYLCSFLISSSRKISILSSFYFYLYPLAIVYSVDYMREIIIITILVISLYHFILFIKYRKKINLFLTLFFSLLIAGMHSGMLSILFSYIIIITSLDKKYQKFKFTIPRMLIIVFIISLIYNSFLWPILSGKLSRLESAESLQDLAPKIHGTTDYIAPPRSNIEAIAQVPIRFIFFLISPLPWQVNSFYTFIAMVLDGVLRWLIIYKILLNIRKAKFLPQLERVIFYSFLIILVFSTLTFSWGTNNFGTAMRHRLKLLPMEILMAYTIFSKNDSEYEIKHLTKQDK